MQYVQRRGWPPRRHHTGQGGAVAAVKRIARQQVRREQVESEAEKGNQRPC